MENLIDYLRNGWTHAFQVHEFNEPLMMTYNILSWAVRDQADSLMLCSKSATWYKEGIQVGELQLKAVKPILTFSELLLQIINRDPIVKDMLNLISSEDDRTIYKVVLPR